MKLINNWVSAQLRKYQTKLEARRAAEAFIASAPRGHRFAGWVNAPGGTKVPVWLKIHTPTSKYMPHQGKQECNRRQCNG